MGGLRVPNGTAWWYNSHETVKGAPTLSIHVVDEGTRNVGISIRRGLNGAYMNGTETDLLEMTEMYLRFFRRTLERDDGIVYTNV